MRERDKDEIRHQIDLIFRAFIDKDRETLRAAHAPEWCGFGLHSRSTIKGLDAYMTEAEETLHGGEYLEYEMMEIDYLFYGNACVVPYVARVRGLTEAGEPFEVKLRSIEVYVQQQSTWRQVASNTSLHPDSAGERRYDG